MASPSRVSPTVTADALVVPQGPQQAVLRVRTSPRVPDPAPGSVAWVRAAQALDEAGRRRLFAAFSAHPGATVVAAPRPGGVQVFGQDRVADGVTIARTPGVFATAALAIRQDVFGGWDLAGVVSALAAGELVWLADPIEVAGPPLPAGNLEDALAWLPDQAPLPSRPARWPEPVRPMSDPAVWGVDGGDPTGAILRGELRMAARCERPAVLQLRVVAETSGWLLIERDGAPWGEAPLEGAGSAYDLDISLDGGPDPVWLVLSAGAARVARVGWQA
jgi:hypothetical protein